MPHSSFSLISERRPLILFRESRAYYHISPETCIYSIPPLISRLRRLSNTLAHSFLAIVMHLCSLRFAISFFYFLWEWSGFSRFKCSALLCSAWANLLYLFSVFRATFRASTQNKNVQFLMTPQPFVPRVGILSKCRLISVEPITSLLRVRRSQAGHQPKKQKKTRCKKKHNYINAKTTSSSIMATDFQKLDIKKFPPVPGRKTAESRYWMKFKVCGSALRCFVVECCSWRL